MSVVLDLLIFLQRPNKRTTKIRDSLMPLLKERTKGLGSHQLEAYMKKVINLEDIVPSLNRLNAT